MEGENVISNLFEVGIVKRNRYEIVRGNQRKVFDTYITVAGHEWSNEEIRELQSKGLIEHFTSQPTKREYALIPRGRSGMVRLQTINHESGEFEDLGEVSAPSFYKSSGGFVTHFHVPLQHLPLIPSLVDIENIDGVRKLSEKYPDGEVQKL